MKKLQLGVFLPIANNGWIISENSPQYLPTFKLNKEIALLAEEKDFDYIFTMAKWRGFGGKTKFWDYSMESFTLMSALAAITSRVRIIATVQPLLYPPVVAAKMAATIDDISGGRFGINIITGSDFNEYSPIVEIPEDYPSYRYDYVDEWVQIVKQLWTEDEVNYEGKYITVKNAVCDPKPIQKNGPSIICAGVSDKGLSFTIKQGTDAFISGIDISKSNAISLKVKESSNKLGRSIKTNTIFTLVLGESDDEAQQILGHYLEGADEEALDNVRKSLGKGAPGSSALNNAQRARESVFYGPMLAGGPKTIANTLEDLAVNGKFDGVLFTFPDFIKGIHQFHNQVEPILKSRGIR